MQRVSTEILSPERSLALTWPRGLLVGLGACLIATLLTFTVARIHYATDKHRLIIIGDSVVANYRAAPGSRVQDIAQQHLGGSWAVQNFAESGARMADYYLLLAKAELLGFKPDAAVLELNPSKLVREFDSGADLDEDGRGLMWLPMNREGVAYAKLRSAHFRDLVPLRKASLLFGFYEGLRNTWLERINWPARRRLMAKEDRRVRRQRMRQRAIELGQEWSTRVELQTYEQYLASPRVRDLEFLLQALARRGVRTSVLLPPWPNQHVIDAALTPHGHEVLAQSRTYLLRFCAERGVPVTELDNAATLATFTDQHWDDLEHLRSPHAYAVMGEAVAATVQANRGQ